MCVHAYPVQSVQKQILQTKKGGSIQLSTRKIRLALAVPLLCATFIVLGACSSGTASTNSPSVKSKPEDYNEAAELTFFGNSAQSQEYFNKYYGDAIRKKFPNYKLTYLQIDSNNKATTLPELIAAGTTIDMYYATIGNFESALREFDMQVDITDWIKTESIDTSRFEATLMEAMKVNTGGPIYGLPVQSNVEALYYNKDIFDKFGVSYPKDGMTWDEAAELSKKLTRIDGGKQYYGFGATFSHILRANQLSLARVDKATGKPLIHIDPGWKTLYDTLFGKMMGGDEYKQSFIQSKSLDNINGFIKDQNVATLAFFAQLYLTNPTELQLMNWDMVTLPTFKEKPGVGSQLYPMFFGPTKLTKNKEAVLKVIKFMVSEEYQTGLARKGWMSVLTTDKVRNEYAQDTPFKDKNYKALFINKPAPIVYTPEIDPSLITIHTNAAYSILKGEADINTAFRTAEQAAQKAIDDFKAKNAK
ncbi:extracellular solute-binding protein [Paenibacillus hemerocallicola]|uniref:Extracellular solute-binding protein n=1 Tax=Paenibacillus hemerocallicola TaxID=1172614 RepID=A0A5C4TBQ0_9BACL|nr:extracellular solute-binding protein [Paenibacillus hemerocallicola]